MNITAPKKVKIKYSDEELRALMITMAYNAVAMKVCVSNIKLYGILMDKIAIRMAKASLNHRKNYTFTYTEDEATAFVLCMNEKHFESNNPWTVNLFRSTYESMIIQLL